MGQKLKDLGFDADRRDFELVAPLELSLVWATRTDEFGPADFLLSEHPELAWAYDPTIADPIPPDYIEMALSKKGDGCYVGILQPIGFRKVKVDGQLRLIVVFGRGRTRIGREANRRIKAAGDSAVDFIKVPARIRDTDDLGAALERDIENLHRKAMSPTAIGRIVRFHVDKGTPEHLLLPLLRPFGVTSMSGAQRHLMLLDAPTPIQALVDEGKLPITEAVRIKAEDADKVVAAAKDGKITAKQAQEARGIKAEPVMMSRRKIQVWMDSLTPKEKLIKAVLKVVLGEGTIDDLRKV